MIISHITYTSCTASIKLLREIVNIRMLIAIRKTRISKRTRKYVSDTSPELTFFLVLERARISFDISWPRSLSHKEHFYVVGTSCSSMRNVYVRVLKNSSLEILGNPIFFLLDSTAGSLPGRAQLRDKEGGVMEIECKLREELREAERQAHAYIYTERASEWISETEKERARENEFYSGGPVSNTVA